MFDYNVTSPHEIHARFLTRRPLNNIVTMWRVSAVQQLSQRGTCSSCASQSAIVIIVLR